MYDDSIKLDAISSLVHEQTENRFIEELYDGLKLTIKKKSEGFQNLGQQEIYVITTLMRLVEEEYHVFMSKPPDDPGRKLIAFNNVLKKFITNIEPLELFFMISMYNKPDMEKWKKNIGLPYT